MGALPPSPRDLALLFSRMDAFRFTRIGACRTIDLLDRRTGLSRDGTRAPMQVRNGWRPHGRLLDHQPAALSKDGRFFVQPTGTTSAHTSRTLHKLSIERHRGQITVLVDDQQMSPFRVQESDLDHGLIGLGLFGHGRAVFRDLIVESLAN